MAQALYDAHPLQEYLQESGDRPGTIPGGLDTYTMDTDDERDDYAGPSVRSSGWQTCAANAFNKARRLLRLAPTPDDDFAERFKYDVISSSLLNSSLSITPSTSQGQQNHYMSRPMSPVPPVPGRMPSTPIASCTDYTTENGLEQSKEVAKTNDEANSMSGAIVLIGLAALMNQHGLAAALAMVSSLFFTRAEHSHTGRLSYISQTMEALKALKAAGNVWDSVVSDTMELLEGEERSTYYTAAAPHSPSSPLRIALHSSLTTTQQQCDNVRPLLAALASPVQLSQLSEMYAPPIPSPAKGNFKLNSNPRASSSLSSPSRSTRHSLVTRSADFDDASNADMHTTPSPRDKRSTWNGPYTYMSLANFDRSSSRTQVMRQRVRQRSDVRSLMEGHSAPTTPDLPNVPEAESDCETHKSTADQFTLDTGSTGGFGKAALSLRRRRRASGIQSMGLVSSHSDPMLQISPTRTPGSSSSRFTHTPLQLPRHPLSLPALRVTLNSALASRRYACAHLLALRFEDDSNSQSHSRPGSDGDYEDEAYWENVIAVMALLTSTLEDASSRLGEALEEAVGRVGMDGPLSATFSPSPNPSPVPSPGPSTLQRSASPSCERDVADTLLSWRNAAPPTSASSTSLDPFSLLTPRISSGQQANSRHIPMSPLSTTSFAPAPTRLARFAEHVDAIAGALEDAKAHLWESVREARAGEGKGKRASLVSASASSAGGSGDHAEATSDNGESPQSQEDAALQAYDRLRRELGLALRECERGRGVLQNIIEARRRKSQLQVEQEEEDAANSPTSAAGVGSGDSESDGKEGPPATPNDGSPILALPTLESVLASQYQHTPSRPEVDDDVTQHLLLTSTPTHLPAPGAEQVFECDLGPESAPAFNRERSKLSRQERIRLVRTRRESGMFDAKDVVRADDEQGMDREKRNSWGPGTEVVQELKDVIWKVSEKKRRMVSASTSASGNEAGDASSTASPQTSALPLHSSDSTLGLQRQSSDDYETTLETL